MGRDNKEIIRIVNINIVTFVDLMKKKVNNKYMFAGEKMTAKAVLLLIFREHQLGRNNCFNLLFLFVIFLFSILVACGQQNNDTKKHIVDIKARQLNDSALALWRHSLDSLDKVKAIALLDKATVIDSNFHAAYSNKFYIQMEIKQYDNALITSKQMIRLKPHFAEGYKRAGSLCEILGDTISADKYFQSALTLYDKYLDTMKTTNKNYCTLLINKGITLIILGQQQKGHDILKQICNEKIDEMCKEMATLYVNKSKKEILDEVKGITPPPGRR
jgi:tetratricopeptide (TPR) repeat protein